MAKRRSTRRNDSSGNRGAKERHAIDHSTQRRTDTHRHRPSAITAGVMAVSNDEMDAHVQDMLDKHTRLVEVSVCGHQEEWRATKHAYPPVALEKLVRARKLAWPGCEPTSDPNDTPAPLVDEDGIFSAESSDCCICSMPLVTRPSVSGPFTVGFSLQVTLQRQLAPTISIVCTSSITCGFALNFLNFLRSNTSCTAIR